MSHYQIKKVHISELRQGHTVLVNWDMQTVSKKHLNHDEIFGHQYKGYCHHETKGMIDVVLFPRFYKGELVGWS